MVTLWRGSDAWNDGLKLIKITTSRSTITIILRTIAHRDLYACLDDTERTAATYLLHTYERAEPVEAEVASLQWLGRP